MDFLHSPGKARGKFKNMRKALRQLIRSAVYATPLHRLSSSRQSQHDGDYWDRQLSGPFKSYLGGTVTVDVRNAVTLALLQILHPEMRKLLDIGCASGSLARSAGAADLEYTGVDISVVAIDEARRLSPGKMFHVARLEDYRPDQAHDSVVFNEVLYYLSVEDAVREYHRYAASLQTDGVVAVSMKHDPKSKAIMQAIAAESKWVTGVLTQEKQAKPGWRIETDRASPAYLIGVFKPG